MNWHQARTLAEDHQSRSCMPAVAVRKPRARRRFNWAVVEVGLRLGAVRPARSLAA